MNWHVKSGMSSIQNKAKVLDFMVLLTCILLKK